MKRLSLIFVLAGLVVSGCGKSPEEAKAELAKQQIAVSEQSLLAQTKSAETQESAKNLLIVGVDPNARQENGMTALMSAALHGQKATVQSLLEKNANLEIEARGFTALICAVSGGHKEIVEVLLAKGANVNHVTEGGNSALKTSRANKSSEIEQLLLKAGAKE